MPVTKFDNLNALGCSVKMVTKLPTAPYDYFGADSQDVDSMEWRGGEMAYHTGDNRLYIQQSTSGITAIWKRLLTTFATSTTTSTSSSTSSTSSTTSSTSSSSSTTSTTTSTSSTTTSTTSTSTTTTAGE